MEFVKNTGSMAGNQTEFCLAGVDGLGGQHHSSCYFPSSRYYQNWLHTTKVRHGMEKARTKMTGKQRISLSSQPG